MISLRNYSDAHIRLAYPVLWIFKPNPRNRNYSIDVRRDLGMAIYIMDVVGVELLATQLRHPHHPPGCEAMVAEDFALGSRRGLGRLLRTRGSNGSIVGEQLDFLLSQVDRPALIQIINNAGPLDLNEFSEIVESVYLK